MNLVLLAAACLADAPPGDWRFIDEPARDGRSLLTFRTAELSATPARPLHADDTPPPGSRFGSAALGVAGARRLSLVWHAPSRTLWVDADNDGRFTPAERHTLDAKPVSAAVTVPVGGRDEPRTLLLRRRGDGVAYCVRGYTTGALTLGGKSTAALLADGDADGCFDQAGADRVWLDLDGDGRLDPLTEQFPLGVAVAHAGSAYLFAPRPDGLGVSVRERPAETGTLAVRVPCRPGAKVVRVEARFVSEFGEAVTVADEDRAVAVPAGQYRVSSLALRLADGNGRVWGYEFYAGTRAVAVTVARGRESVCTLPEGVRLSVALDVTAVKAGEPVAVSPDVSAAGGLYLLSCATDVRDGDEGRGAEAEIRLSDGGTTLDRAASGFS